MGALVVGRYGVFDDFIFLIFNRNFSFLPTKISLKVTRGPRVGKGDTVVVDHPVYRHPRDLDL